MPQVYGDRWENQGTLKEAGQAFTYKVKDITKEYEGIQVLKQLKNYRNLDRFKNEVEALKELDHEGIVKLLDFDLLDDRPWFVQEYYEGGDLEDFIQTEGRIDIGLALDFFIQLCNALTYAHEKQKIHRDIKPANIFLRGIEGPIVLGDFGLTFKETDELDRITLTDEQVGSRFYIAPELRDGRLVEPNTRCDIYSLGKVLYFMLSGGRKFDREDFRDKRWDLVYITDNVHLEHVNVLLGSMITLEPERRIPASALGNSGRKIKKLILGNFPSLQGIHYSRCNYCGKGFYFPKSNDTQEFRDELGLRTTIVTATDSDWRALVCNHCGHLQIFLYNHASEKWWPNN